MLYPTTTKTTFQPDFELYHKDIEKNKQAQKQFFLNPKTLNSLNNHIFKLNVRVATSFVPHRSRLSTR